MIECAHRNNHSTRFKSGKGCFVNRCLIYSHGNNFSASGAHGLNTDLHAVDCPGDFRAGIDKRFAALFSSGEGEFFRLLSH